MNNFNNFLRKFNNILLEYNQQSVTIGKTYCGELKSDQMLLSTYPDLKTTVEKIDRGDTGYTLADIKSDGFLICLENGSFTDKYALARVDSIKNVSGTIVTALAKLSGATISGSGGSSGTTNKVELKPAAELCFFIVYDYDASVSHPVFGSYKKYFNPLDVKSIFSSLSAIIDGASFGRTTTQEIVKALTGKNYKFVPSASLESAYPSLKESSGEKFTPNYDVSMKMIIRQIEVVIDRYNKRHSLSSTLTSDDRWNQDDQTAWADFVEHVFTNKTIPGIDRTNARKDGVKTDWGNEAEALQITYPGYTPDPRGVLAFVADAYNENDEQGKKKRDDKPIASGRRGSGGGGRGGRSQQKAEAAPLPSRRARDIQITLQGRLARNRKAQDMIQDFKQIIASNLKNGEMAEKDNVNLVVSSRADGMQVKFSKGTRYFENPLGVTRGIQNALRRLRVRGSISITIPRGKY